MSPLKRKLATLPVRSSSMSWRTSGVREQVAARIPRDLALDPFRAGSAQLNKPYEVERIGGRVLDTLKEIGRLTGELSAFTSQSINVVNSQTIVMNSPIVAELQAELLQTLAPYQDARAAVIAMFVRLDERHRNPDLKLIEGHSHA
jgi:hypothetical protein